MSDCRHRVFSTTYTGGSELGSDSVVLTLTFPRSMQKNVAVISYISASLQLLCVPIQQYSLIVLSLRQTLILASGYVVNHLTPNDL
jgi:hypothetical protein